jgi:hypothetical protein
MTTMRPYSPDRPANTTTPAAVETTDVPRDADRSTPWWPDPLREAPNTEETEALSRATGQPEGPLSAWWSLPELPHAEAKTATSNHAH